MPRNEDKTFELVKSRLNVAAVCDILDSLNYRHQAMHQRLRPLLPDPKRCGFLGHARTIRWMETDYVVEEDPYGLEIDVMTRSNLVRCHSTRPIMQAPMPPGAN